MPDPVIPVAPRDVFRYITLGAGVQSSALMAMSALGLRDCPKATCAIFADTQDEPPWVYEQLAALATFGGIHGLPVITVTHGKISTDRRVQLPAFVYNDDGEVGPLKRSCTQDYKTRVVRREARRLMALGGYTHADCQFGISLDEWTRMSVSPLRWLTHSHPLITARMTRSACADILREVGLPVPRKSACRFCPYHSDRAWREIRDHDPEGWIVACDFDDRIHADRGARLHRSMIPLRQIDFGEDNPDMFDQDCGGNCGV
jgi:hypothetical protein